MDGHDLFKEAEEIKNSIKTFFSDDKDFLDKYHIQIKKRIDELFEVNSHTHRNLHQFIAISHYCFEKGIMDINKGAIEFSRAESLERLQFDVNYFKEYNQLSNEGINRLINADESCKKLYGYSLGELMKRIFFS